ncbi:MAG: magnesium chelatase subunit D [Gemmatimonadota bacterium]|nr:magnesium chelatase subunit D [Gemmatimonadota bacterium]MDQ8166598.1 magnesium chelatase subunit D [Gemmatimonadota bacterium]MDQ8172277.1 magnesium chelatase subunit D [Gemmatimonadota bacterium]
MSSPHADLPRGGPALTALLLAVDARGLCGAVLDHPLHEHARAFTALLQRALPEGAPLRRVPAGVTPDRLYGGVDLAATLSRGRIVSEKGVLAAADGGVLVVPMAERLSIAARTALCEVLDHADVQVARDGIAERHSARVCAVIMDESIDDEAVHDALRDRLAFVVRLDGTADTALPDDMAAPMTATWARLARDARHRLMSVSIDDTWIEALCQTADAFGIDSVRAPLLALRCARAHAALHGRLMMIEADAEIAAALVLAPRATRWPAPPETPPEQPPAGDEADSAAQNAPPPTPPPAGESEQAEPETPPDDPDREQPTSPSSQTDLLRQAVASALPPGLLAQLLEQVTGGAMHGRVGAERQNMLRGRPRGARSGLPRGGARLHLLDTLRAAAPWQRVRQRYAALLAASTAPASAPRIAIRREDFRIRRYIEKTGTTVLFVVDASGSSALHRLAEAKGAVEMLLAESYARRDRVSLLAFRGQGTEVLLPPTRALARAKKVLAALPGGGGTPMAHAIETALEQALATRRGGSAPLVVMLTDGRANIARDGTPGRAGAERDAIAAAGRLAQQNIPALFVDTSLRGEPVARRLADAMRARYVLLPAANAKALGGLVRTAMQMADGSDRGDASRGGTSRGGGGRA